MKLTMTGISRKGNPNWDEIRIREPELHIEYGSDSSGCWYSARPLTPDEMREKHGEDWAKLVRAGILNLGPDVKVSYRDR